IVCEREREFTMASFSPLPPERFGRFHATREAVRSRVDELQALQAPERIWARDPTFFTDDPRHAERITQRLGWLDSPQWAKEQVERWEALRREVWENEVRDLVLLGMGGSSLAPEVLSRTLPAGENTPRFHLLDSTDPEAVEGVRRAIDPAHTLFLVASKSGTTIEVRSFFHFFYEAVTQVKGEGAATTFVAITDPDTPLAELAERLRFRKTLLNPPDIGGRYSALSHFGLVAAKLCARPVEALLADALRMRSHMLPEIPAERNPALWLGAFLGHHAMAGRNKLTLLLSPEIAPFGAWLEQLIAESTGKEGKGIVPIDLEPPTAIDRYGEDRIFVVLRLRGGMNAPLDQMTEALKGAGRPLCEIALQAPHELGGEFFRWAFATATAAALLRINPFDEPNVSEAKEATKACLEAFQATGSLPSVPSCSPDDPALARLISGLRPHDYFALCPFFQATAKRDEKFAALRRRIRDHTRNATTLGYGPRFLHSTGQLHKGGPQEGVFLQLTAQPHID
ncbi:MAG: hypothetical protein D6812_14575, partial [Deltaproteobacteria bacterium]